VLIGRRLGCTVPTDNYAAFPTFRDQVSCTFSNSTTCPSVIVPLIEHDPGIGRDGLEAILVGIAFIRTMKSAFDELIPGEQERGTELLACAREGIE
jgi:hypothetical protein